MPLIVKGQHLGASTEFKKGMVPWNKGKHPKRLKGKWSLKYESCSGCWTKKKEGRNKHYANGLCISCYFKELRRKINPAKRKLKTIERWQTIKSHPELHASYLKYCVDWRKRSAMYKHSFERRKKRQRYQSFIAAFFEKKKSFKQYPKHMIITVEVDGKDIKVPTPVKDIFYNMSEMFMFQKEVKRYLNKREKAIHDSQSIDNHMWHRL